MAGINAFRLLSLLPLAAILAWPLSGNAGQPLVLAFSELYPWKTRDGAEFGGAYTEIAKELARRIDAPLRIDPCPLKRCLLMMQEGQADIIIGVQASPERKEYLHFLQTPYRKRSSDKVFYVMKEKKLRASRYEDLRRLRIGMLNGAEYFDRFDEDDRIRKDVALDNVSNFRKLAAGHIDAMVIAEDQGEPLVSKLGLRGQVEKLEFRVKDPTPRAIGVSKKSVRHIKPLEGAMASMVKDGTLRALIQRHYYEAYQIPPDSVPTE